MLLQRPRFRALMAACLLLSPQAANAHFLWLSTETSTPGGTAVVRAFLNEEPTPGGPEFLKYVKAVKPTADGHAVASSIGEATVDATWVGPLPRSFDAEQDLGIKTRSGVTYRLFYTARAQNGAASADQAEIGGKLRVRLVSRYQTDQLQVLFDGKPVAKARIKAYPQEGEPKELTADANGFATIDGLAQGKTAVWANWTEPKPGTIDSKNFTATRYYATLTFTPLPQNSRKISTAIAEMPEPAVNSFGGAVLGDWLYVYSGHIGRTHQYNTDTTSRKFRRLHLKHQSWEELPMPRDLQGLALVSDGRSLYRVGGMSARNQPGTPEDLHSVADFARFDPETKTWTNLAPMPQPRSTHDAVIIGTKLYVVGGWTMRGATDESTFLEDALVFDLSTPEAGWTSLKQPFRRRALSAAEAGGKLYVLGGLTDEGKVVRRVDMFDPATNTWSLVADLPGTHKREGFGTSSFGIAGRLYYSGATGQIFRLDETGRAWQAIGAWSLPRITHRLLTGPGQTLLAVGGTAVGQPTPVIESVNLTNPASPAITHPQRSASNTAHASGEHR